ncbi:MAG: hypothetical protein JWO62_2654 [Acidimicrobiaceae bacterium]|nr:hypothetical protein [Acidimicrobiaceae bacterium]
MALARACKPAFVLAATLVPAASAQVAADAVTTRATAAKWPVVEMRAVARDPTTERGDRPGGGPQRAAARAVTVRDAIAPGHGAQRAGRRGPSAPCCEGARATATGGGGWLPGQYAAAVTVAGVVLALAQGPARGGGLDSRRPRRGRPAIRPLAALVVEAALAAGLDEVVVCTDLEELASAIPDGAAVLLDRSSEPSEASALRAAVDWCAREGHDSVVVALAHTAGKDAPLDPALWREVAGSRGGPVVVGTRQGRRVGPVRIDAQAWPLLPLTGAVEALWRSRPELVTEVAAGEAAPGSQSAPSGVAGLVRESARPEDLAAVEALLGRPVQGRFSVVVRSGSGEPVVIRNEPLLADGTPMPTRYWLVGRAEREAVARLESAGGVRAAEAAVPAAELAEAHDRYAAERDATLPPGHRGPRPTGGVGGTRTGVKCLHAHLAWYLAGGVDPVGGWVVRQIEGQIEGAVAAVDCGTNSTRLLVLDATGRTVDRQMRITRLGEGVDRTGALSPEAIERTVAALREFREIMDAAGIVRCRATATSAARDAQNAPQLFDAAEEALGTRPELLEGHEEGRLSYRGATRELPSSDGPYLVVDLGGGSTELVVGPPNGEDGGGATAVSLDVGCVRVTERFLKSDPPEVSEIADAAAYARGLVDAALEREPALGRARRMVGVAGTVSTLAVLDLGLERYSREQVHHAVISRARVAALAGELLAETSAERAKRPGIEQGRADVIAGGALVLAEIMAATGHDELVVSESDILDGIAAELLG